MEEVGYMVEILSRGHRPGPDPEHDATNLMQGMKRHLSAGDRRRSSGGGMETGGGDEEDTVEMPSSSTSAARTTTRRTTRHGPVPREENLTEEDWAIMRAVERCPVWKTIKSFNLREREKLLAAICMILQETVEGNTETSTINTVEDFRNWARRWGEDDDHAQLTLQNLWDNLLCHLMGITAVMEVWGPTNVTDPGENSVGNGTCGTPCLQGNSGGASTPGTTAEVGQAADEETPMELWEPAAAHSPGGPAGAARRPTAESLVGKVEYGGYGDDAALEDGGMGDAE